MISQRTMGRTLTLALLVVAAHQAATMASVAPKTVAGKLQTSGQVYINGIAAAPGGTVFSRSRISTGADGTAQIVLGKQGRIEVAPNSDVVLQLSEEKIGGTLLKGRAVVSASPGTSISLIMAETTATTDGQKAVVLIGSLDGGTPRIAAAGGSARIAAGGRIEALASGQEAVLGTGSGRDIRIGSAAETINRTLSSRTVSNPGITALLRDSISRSSDTLTGGAARPTGSRDLPTRGSSRQPDTRRTPPSGVAARSVRDVSRIIP